jgi:hypothetical protein
MPTSDSNRSVLSIPPFYLVDHMTELICRQASGFVRMDQSLHE